MEEELTQARKWCKRAGIAAWILADQGQTVAWLELGSGIGLNVYDDVVAFYLALYLLGIAGVSRLVVVLQH